MTPRSTLRLATRASLLAMAQSRIVARAIQAADPGLEVELVTVETRGDRDRSVPLSDVRDPGFFSAELDDALREGRVDLCVHSVKDLPLQPRPGIHTAAIPAREDPRDMVIFRPQVLDLLRNGETLRIGSSSARRAVLTREFLQHALPAQGPGAGDAPPAMSFPPLRGLVEQRLARVRLPRDHDQALDGVVLALAGLARLWGDRDGHARIAPLLEGTRLMVLPLGACPTAPGQGALAVECRSDDARVSALLAPINHAGTARRVRRELDLLSAQPETERDGFGATTVRHDNCGTLLFLRSHGGGRVLWKEPPSPGSAIAWDGAEWIRASHYQPRRHAGIGSPPAVFLAHWRALPPRARLPDTARVWVSGMKSWRALARRGIWVEGCADNLGFQAVLGTLRSPVLRLPPLADWTVLTREDATATWQSSGVGRVLATYDIAAPEDESALSAIRHHVAGSTHFFWGSAAQYRALRDWLPANSHHACGPGKTFDALQADGVANLQAFPSRREWQAWLP